MKIKYQSSNKEIRMRDVFNVGISPSLFDDDEYDYFAYITLFGREWHWYIYK